MEFVGFTYLVQIARNKIGSSGLGGNGQFTRLPALMSQGASPWKPSALTEDLGLRLVEAGWRTCFCHHTTVAQQGLTSWQPLLRQRTRWIQRHYQCWTHIPRLLRLISLALSLLPLATFMYTYQRHSRHAYRWWEVPAFAIVFSAYSYVWIVTTLRAWTRLLLRRNGWVKTPRVGGSAASAAQPQGVAVG